jgi:hypothetical protein
LKVKAIADAGQKPDRLKRTVSVVVAFRDAAPARPFTNVSIRQSSSPCESEALPKHNPMRKSLVAFKECLLD